MSYDLYQPKNEWEYLVLQYPLFQDDFGEPGDVVMKDRIVRGRKEFTCCECGDTIDIGTLQRYHVGKYGGDLLTYRFCEQCCVAMAMSWTDDGQMLEDRAQLRRERDGKPNPGQ